MLSRLCNLAGLSGEIKAKETKCLEAAGKSFKRVVEQRRTLAKLLAWYPRRDPVSATSSGIPF